MNILRLLCMSVIITSSLHAQVFTRGRKLEEKTEAMQKQLDILNQAHQTNKPLLNDLNQMNQKFMQQKADTSVMIENLRNENQLLKGEIAFLKRQMELFENNQKRFFQDAEFRLGEMEGQAKKKRPTARKKPSTTPAKKALPVVEESIASTPQQDYEQALNALQKQKKPDQAITGFQKFIDKHPKNSLIPNAYYWMGQSYYDQQQYARAIKTFDIISKSYPKSSKKCDAVLMQAKGFEALKKETEAKLFYSEVVSLCPRTEASKKAQAKLKG